MDGLPSTALASSPPSGRARSRLTRMVLFRSQESSRASSRRWSVASVISNVYHESDRGGYFGLALLAILRLRQRANHNLPDSFPQRASVKSHGPFLSRVRPRLAEKNLYS